MLYKDYGKTGIKISAVGFGGMRFGAIDDHDKCVEMIVEAAKGGINYFDTAPLYFGTKSEEVTGKGLAELRRLKLPYYLATKTMAFEEGAIRKEIEAQLKRLKVDYIDFYHIWCILSLDNWHLRKQNKIIETFIKLKEEGLIKHICISSHLIGNDIKELLMEDVIEGVLFGYSASNFAFRDKAFEAIKKKKLGCVVMNPLGGGLIPDNPQIFDFIKTQNDETVVEAALRFIFAHKDITTALVGFGNLQHVKEAIKAAEGYKEISEATIESMKENIKTSFKDLCTGCQYCDHCPEGIKVPALMDAYNHKKLYKKDQAILDRLYWHWNIPASEAAKCIECGKCEQECTQHLPIIKRMEEIAKLK